MSFAEIYGYLLVQHPFIVTFTTKLPDNLTGRSFQNTYLNTIRLLFKEMEPVFETTNSNLNI